MTPEEFRRKYELIKNRSRNKTRKCLHLNCSENAIKSHVLQKNGILKQISEKNHLFQFSNVSSFEVEQKGSYELKKIGINDAFTFPGFCKLHDSEIFKPIESDKNIDLNSPKSICLFSYRSLCQEIWRKEVSLEIATEILDTNYSIATIILFSDLKKGLVNGLKNLNFFKEELEKELETQSDNFIFEVCEIPRVDICISGPLNILDSENPMSETHDINGNFSNNPFTTSVVNLFPYKNKSYLMTGQHKDYKCRWTQNLFDKTKSGNESQILQIVSDLISTRFEFWCISPILKEKLKPGKIEQLFSIWQNEVLNFDFDIKTKFNVFD